MPDTTPIDAYSWGAPEDLGIANAFLSGKGVTGAASYVASRPPLATWSEIDRALDDAIAACGLRLVVVLAPRDAETIARSLYVWAEPGPDVIALGYEDLSVSCNMSGDNDAMNDALLGTLLQEASIALDEGDLASALLSLATNIRRLCRAPARTPKTPVG